ncbi:MAG: SRPBCC family protein [Bacteroidales bacterium]
MKIESKTGKTNYPAVHVYHFISDFRNFKNFIPADKVTEWQADSNTCSFRMDLLGKISLDIVEKEPVKLVKISSNPKVSQYNFNLWIQIKEVSESESRIKVTIEPKLNQVLLSMVKSPLKSFVDSLVDEVEKFQFPGQ